MNSVTLTQVQKFEFNIGWLENYRAKSAAIAKDLQADFVAVRQRLNEVTFQGDWAAQWNAQKPKRNIAHMLESLHFYEELDRFLESKKTGMQLLLNFHKNPEEINPVEIAQHQVRHQHVLEQLERISGSDCEEMLAELELGLMMTQNGQSFEVN